MKNFLTKNRIFTYCIAMIVLTNTIHAYSPSTILAPQGTNSSATLTAICGTGFNSSNSLVGICGGTGVMDITTDSLHAIAVSGTHSLANLAGSSFSTGTDSLHTLRLVLNDIEGGTFDATKNSLSVISGGASFDSTTDSLHAIAVSGANSLHAIAVSGTNSLANLATTLTVVTKQIAVNQVISAGSNAAISAQVIGATNATTFNSDMNTVFTDLKIALTTPNNGNISTLQSDITAAQAVNLTSGVITSPYSQQAIDAGLQQLQTAVTYWLSFYP